MRNVASSASIYIPFMSVKARGRGGVGSGDALHNLWHLARFVIRQIEMLFICGTCAPAQPEADDDKCENVDDVHGLSPGVALTVVASPLPCPALPPATGHSSICGSIPRCVFVCDKIFTCLQIERLELSSVCFACFMPRLRLLPSPTPHHAFPTALPTPPGV